MDIKDTKDFEEKLDRDWDDNPTKYVRPYIPEMVIQDRTKIIESVIEMVKTSKNPYMFPETEARFIRDLSKLKK